MNTLTQLRAAFVDNPILAKDAILAGRRPAAVVGLCLALTGITLGICLGLAIAAANGDHLHGALDVLGQPLFVGLLIAFIAVQGVILPMLASTTIASERERGTLDLLTTSALTPGRIVAGKLGALLMSYLPFVLLATPLLALPMWAGEVSLAQTVGGLLLIAFNGVVLISGGLLCSAWANNSRTSAAFSFVLSAAVLWPVVVGPSIFLVAIQIDQDVPSMGPVWVLLGLAGLVLIAHAAVSARGRIAPRAVAQRVYRWRVTRAALIAVPAAAAASPLLISPDNMDGEVWRHLITLPIAVLLIFLVVLEVALAGGRARDEVSEARTAFLTARQATLGLALAAPILWLSTSGDSAQNLGVILSGLVAGSLSLATFAVLTAVVARLTQLPLLRCLLVGGILGVLFLSPVAGFIIYDLLNTGPDFVPLGFTNPLVIAGSGGQTFAEHLRFFDLRARHTDIWGIPAFITGPIFYAAALMVLSPFARRRR